MNLLVYLRRLGYNSLLTGLGKEAAVHPEYCYLCSQTNPKVWSVLRSLHWLQRVDLKAAPLVHKSLYGLAPTYISDMLVPHEPPQTLRSSGKSPLLTPSVETKPSEAALRFHTDKTQSSPPDVVRQTFIMTMFKSNSKLLFFAHCMTDESL